MKLFSRILALGGLATTLAWSQGTPAPTAEVKPAAPAPVAEVKPAAPAPTAEVKPAAPAPAPLAPPARASLAQLGEGLSIEELIKPETVKLFEALPVQDGGRVKPFDTVARFRLLKYHGKQSMRVDKAKFGKGKITATEWAMITWFKPDLAKTLPVFVVDNSEAVVAIGVKAKGPRDRYSYDEIAQGRESLMNKMQEIRAVEAKERSPLQRALGKLSLDFLDYEMMLNHFNFARNPFGKNESLVPAELLAPVDGRPADIADVLPRLGKYLETHPEAAAPMSNPWLMDFYHTLLGAMMSGNPEQAFRIFPPDVNQVEVWQSPGELMQRSLQGGENNPNQVDELRKYGQIYRAFVTQQNFHESVESYVNTTIKVAKDRNEYRFVPLEVSYHKSDYFYKALLWFFFSMIALGLSWTSPVGKFGRYMRAATWASVLAGAGLGVVGIVIRCVIMQRPPITTLYETILFISITGVILALFAEWLTKRGIGLTAAVLAGVLGMFLSIRYMNMEGTDTMQQLQAVLITNFWLATHVPIINLGYSAGMIASIIAMFYFITRLFGITKAGDTTAKDLTRISYGFVMGGLFLSLVGTILGGIWANDSWGRFWGWDPKENGALMIVLMKLIILHARLGGYIREVGFHAFTIVLGMIVIFSWFGTNQLGVGLHAYGFTDGVWGWLMITWSFHGLFLIYAAYLAMMDRDPSKKLKK